jgi:hypothetical protein
MLRMMYDIGRCLCTKGGTSPKEILSTFFTEKTRATKLIELQFSLDRPVQFELKHDEPSALDELVCSVFLYMGESPFPHRPVTTNLGNLLSESFPNLVNKLNEIKGTELAGKLEQVIRYNFSQTKSGIRCRVPGVELESKSYLTDVIKKLNKEFVNICSPEDVMYAVRIDGELVTGHNDYLDLEWREHFPDHACLVGKCPVCGKNDIYLQVTGVCLDCDFYARLGFRFVKSSLQIGWRGIPGFVFPKFLKETKDEHRYWVLTGFLDHVKNAIINIEKGIPIEDTTRIILDSYTKYVSLMFCRSLVFGDREEVYPYMVEEFLRREED